jgi:hypothetical protein
MRDRGWIHADASAAVFYEDKEFLPVLSPDPVAYPDREAPYEPFPRTVLAPGGQGLSITGVQLSNQSHEVLSIRSIRADLYTATADRPYRLIIGYPFDHPIIASPSYNLIQPGDMFRLSVDPIDIRPGTRAELHIGIRSESGRYGEIVQQIVP